MRLTLKSASSLRIACVLTVVGMSSAFCEEPPPSARSQTEKQFAEPQQVAGRTLQEWSEELKSDNAIVRLRAAKTVAAFGKPAILVLTQALQDAHPGVQYWAAEGLGDIAAPAPTSLPVLKQQIRHKNLGLRISAAYALCRLGELEAGLPVLTKGLEAAGKGIPIASADYLARIGPPAKAAVAALKKTLQNDDYHVRRAAKEALRKILAARKKADSNSG